MIFVTLGSQKFQFNRLLKEIDKLVEQQVIKEPIIAQIGASTYLPQNYEYVKFMDRAEFAKKMTECSTVITHGGTGVIIDAVKKGKKVIAIPRLSMYKEHVDNHQMQLLHQFDDLGIICACYDVEQLGACYQQLDNIDFRPYVSNTHVIMASIESFLNGIE